ncbi:MAG: hypothetical protein WC648_00870 [Candidatus Paceibacterota bacterium]|jgi:hypothetical protein
MKYRFYSRPKRHQYTVSFQGHRIHFGCPIEETEDLYLANPGNNTLSKPMLLWAILILLTIVVGMIAIAVQVPVNN